MKTIRTDVFVIGAGAAGVRAALAVSEGGVDVLMVAKATVLATGGGAAVFSDHLVTDEAIGDG